MFRDTRHPLTFLLFFAVAIPSFSQLTNVKGKIMSEKDSSVVFDAFIRFENPPNYDKQYDVVSDERGVYSLDDVVPGKYVVFIEKDGFIEFKSEIEFSSQSGNSLDFYIEAVEKPEDEIFVLENLIFSRGSDKIQSSSYTSLDDFAVWLKERPSYIVQLEGHTDITGNPDANVKLSQARVDAVKAYIVKKGVKKDRLLTKAFGGTQPLSTEGTPEAKAANRRVEVRVLSR